MPTAGYIYQELGVGLTPTISHEVLVLMPTSPSTSHRDEQIQRFFDSLPEKVFLHRDLDNILDRHRKEWELPDDMSVDRFVTLLVEKGKLRTLEMFPEERNEGRSVTLTQRTFTRYAWGNVSAYAVAQSLRPQAYLSHASAMFLHGLTHQVPKTIYVNKEQSPKPLHEALLSQEALDRAFKNVARVSNYVFLFEEYRFVLLAGKNTGRLEVSEMDGPNGEILQVTKLERTLIDIAVRPVYAGGVFEVLAAYQAAKDRLSFNTLLATLRKLGHAYPYHQAIGFYMERAGYDEAKLSRLRDLGLKWDFYLTHQIADPEYSPTWKLYYPKGL